MIQPIINRDSTSPIIIANNIIIHLADIHIRDNSRDIYKIALVQLHKQLYDNIHTSSQRVTAVIAGDLFHSKTQLSAENIVDCFALLDVLATVATDIIIMPGNHDANLNNLDRTDLPGPIFDNCRTFGKCRIHYLRKSGWYSIVPGLTFYAFSPIDPIAHDIELQKNVDQNGGIHSIKIALVHDFIYGMSFGGTIHKSDIRNEYLTQFDAVMCGHVHDYMQLASRAGDRHSGAVYCGALTQLTIGESFEKGFVIWRTSANTRALPPIDHEFVRIEVPGAQVKVTVLPKANCAAGVSIKCNMLHEGTPVPADAARVVVEIRAQFAQSSPEITQIVDVIRKRTNAPIEFVSRGSVVSHEVNQCRGLSAHLQDELIVSKLRASGPAIDDATIASVIALHTKISAQNKTPYDMQNMRWRLIYLEWNNLFCYGARNYINFEELHGIVGLTAPNRCGKSAIIDILTLALFNEPLRGSAGVMIRRGCTEGSLRCIWMCDTERCELVRNWDAKGRGSANYTINGQNQTCADLKSTYVAIAQRIGTIDDFQSTVLIPQHGAESFIDMTDAHKRAVLSRILGLDILDGAKDTVSAQMHENQGAIKEMSASISNITSRILARMEPESDASIMLTVDRADTQMRAKLDALRTLETDSRHDVETLECIAAPIAPTDRAVLDARLKKLVAEKQNILHNIGATERAIDTARDTLDTIIARNGGKRDENITRVDLDKMRASCVKLARTIDPHLIILSHSRDFDINAIGAKIVVAQGRAEKLARAKIINDALCAAREAYINLRRLSFPNEVRANIDECISIDIAQSTNANVYSETAIRELEATLHALPTCADVCRCRGRGPKTQEGRDAILQRALSGQFARDEVLPPEFVGLSLTDYLRLIDETRARMSTPPHNDTELMLRFAQLSVALLRSNNSGTTERALDDARFCAKWHSIIDTKREINAKLVSSNNGIRAAKLSECARAYAVARDRMAACGITVNGTSSLENTIFENERTIATLVEIQEKSADIARAIALEHNVSTLESNITIARELIDTRAIIDANVMRVASLRKSSDENTRAIDEMHTEIAANGARETAWKSYESSRQKMNAARATLMRVQATVASLVSEVAELSRDKTHLHEINARLDAIHRANHILSLYRTTIDSKTGIQYNLMARAIELIEREVGRILEPITGLQMKIALGTSDVRIANACDSSSAPIMARATTTKTMRITVHADGIEHSADLCSGFQRFVLNIALRRAFLQICVRARAQFMIIDEGFGCLDQSNLLHVCERLPELAQDLQHMILVSHIEYMRASIDMPVQIKRDADTGASYVRSGSEIVAQSITECASTSAPHAQIKRRTIKISAATVGLDPTIIDRREDGSLYCKICCAEVKVLSRHLKSVKHAKKTAAMLGK